MILLDVILCSSWMLSSALADAGRLTFISPPKWRKSVVR